MTPKMLGGRAIGDSEGTMGPREGATQQLRRLPTRRGVPRRPSMLNDEAPTPAPAPVRGGRIDI
jgi:hypothetical protein